METAPHDMILGWRVVNADWTSRGGYRWPFPGNWATPAPVGQPMTEGEPCPQFEGDGLCIALTPEGAGSGGISPHTVLVVGYYAGDVLGRDDTKVRVRRAYVLDVWDGLALVRGGGQSANLRYAYLQSANLQYADLRYADLRYADLRYANLQSANLRYAYLQYADLRSAYYDEFTGLPTGFDPVAAGMVKV